MAKRDTSMDTVLATIDERIEYLKTIKEAVRHAFNLPEPATVEATEPRKGSRKASKARSRSKQGSNVRANRGESQQAILAVLRTSHGSSLSTAEVFERLQASSSWRTGSKNPKGLVGQQLRHLHNKGLVKCIGSNWEISPEPMQGQDLAQ